MKSIKRLGWGWQTAHPAGRTAIHADNDVGECEWSNLFAAVTFLSILVVSLIRDGCVDSSYTGQGLISYPVL
jgi:hypothetical protein